jgi:adenylate kinase
MILALTGTPGTGKTTIGQLLQERKIPVIDLKKIAIDNGFIESHDSKRDSIIIAIDVVNQFIINNYQSENILVVEGLVSHLLECIDEVIVFRCHPKILRNRLTERKWSWDKIKENLEAEMLDIILCESIELHGIEKVKEIETSKISIEKTVKAIYQEIIGKKSKDVIRPGSIDWSELLFDNNIMEEEENGFR